MWALKCRGDCRINNIVYSCIGNFASCKVPTATLFWYLPIGRYSVGKWTEYHVTLFPWIGIPQETEMHAAMQTLITNYLWHAAILSLSSGTFKNFTRNSCVKAQRNKWVPAGVLKIWVCLQPHTPACALAKGFPVELFIQICSMPARTLQIWACLQPTGSYY